MPQKYRGYRTYTRASGNLLTRTILIFQEILEHNTCIPDLKKGKFP
jgi:hypothetical protein